MKTPPSPPVPAPGKGASGPAPSQSSLLPVTGLAPQVQQAQDRALASGFLEALRQRHYPECGLCGLRHPPPFQRPRGGPGLGD